MAQLIAPSSALDVGIEQKGSWKARVRRQLRSRTPYLRLLGVALFFLGWYLLVDVFGIWRFRELPGLVASFKEWVNPNPVYGVSLFTAEYHNHIWASIVRVASAFVSATFLGIAVGVCMGWSSNLLRPHLSSAGNTAADSDLRMDSASDSSSAGP